MTHSPQFLAELHAWLLEKDKENKNERIPLVLTTQEFIDMAQADLEKAYEEDNRPWIPNFMPTPEDWEDLGIVDEEPEMTDREFMQQEKESHIHG